MLTLPDGTPGPTATMQLYTLAAGRLAWLAPPAGDTIDTPLPEIVLLQETDAGQTVIWRWFAWLLDAVNSQAEFLTGLVNSGWTIERPFQRMRFGRATTRAEQLPFAVAGPEFG